MLQAFNIGEIWTSSTCNTQLSKFPKFGTLCRQCPGGGEPEVYITAGDENWIQLTTKSFGKTTHQWLIKSQSNKTNTCGTQHSNKSKTFSETSTQACHVPAVAGDRGKDLWKILTKISLQQRKSHVQNWNMFKEKGWKGSGCGSDKSLALSCMSRPPLWVCEGADTALVWPTPCMPYGIHQMPSTCPNRPALQIWDFEWQLFWHIMSPPKSET